MVECLLLKKVAVGSNPVVVTWISDNVAVSIKEFADIRKVQIVDSLKTRIRHDKTTQ